MKTSTHAAPPVDLDRLVRVPTSVAKHAISALEQRLARIRSKRDYGNDDRIGRMHRDNERETILDIKAIKAAIRDANAKLSHEEGEKEQL
jgi:hypothetical protein